MPTESRDEVDPRITRTRSVVLAAVLSELAEAGYSGFRIESVAARAGVAKSTIYRHWPDRIGLILDALETLNVQPVTEANASPCDEVANLLEHLARALTEGPLAACLPALIEGAQRDPRLRDLFHGYATRRRQALRDAVERGVRQGAFGAAVDPELAAQALAGAIVYRRVMSADPFTTAEVPALLATVLGADTSYP